jgi:cell volume regulation protein A
VPSQLLIGGTLGVAIGLAGAAVLRRIHLRAGGLFPVLTLGIALLSFGVTTMLQGSGFLAVYATALVIGNSKIPYRNGLTRIHDAVAWLGQIGMFLMLGLLVFPSQLLDVAWMGLGIALLLAFIARPVAVAACLLPFRFPRRELMYIGWVGLRGAVPIILATFPILAQVDGAQRIFNVVFFVVVVNSLVPGSTLRWITRWMKLEVAEPPAPAAALEVNSLQLLKGEILSYFIDETLAVCGVPLSRIKFPEGSSMILVVRGQELLAARGYTVLQPGDHVYVFMRPEDRPYIELLFGRAE